jgi:hypothetical protein
MRVYDPPERRQMLSEPRDLGWAWRRVGDCSRELNDLADGRYREPATEKVGYGKLARRRLQSAPAPVSRT